VICSGIAVAALSKGVPDARTTQTGLLGELDFLRELRRLFMLLGVI
jgi:hypothetical protein